MSYYEELLYFFLPYLFIYRDKYKILKSVK